MNKTLNDIPLITEGNSENEYLFKMKLEDIEGYINFKEGVLLICKGEILKFNEDPLYVYIDEDNREYICINNTILYLDTLKESRTVWIKNYT